jgi:hypothetical protein
MLSSQPNHESFYAEEWRMTPRLSSERLTVLPGFTQPGA